MSYTLLLLWQEDSDVYFTNTCSSSPRSFMQCVLTEKNYIDLIHLTGPVRYLVIGWLSLSLILWAEFQQLRASIKSSPSLTELISWRVINTNRADRMLCTDSSSFSSTKRKERRRRSPSLPLLHLCLLTVPALRGLAGTGQPSQKTEKLQTTARVLYNLMQAVLNISRSLLYVHVVWN